MKTTCPRALLLSSRPAPPRIPRYQQPASENWHGQPERPEWQSYLAYMQLQLRELLTRYGPVALIWFDGLNNQEKYDGAHVLRMIAEMQPATLVNDRLGVDGDYETPEQFIPTAIPTKGVRLTGIDPTSPNYSKPRFRARRISGCGKHA